MALRKTFAWKKHTTEEEYRINDFTETGYFIKHSQLHFKPRSHTHYLKEDTLCFNVIVHTADNCIVHLKFCTPFYVLFLDTILNAAILPIIILRPSNINPFGMSVAL